MVCSALLLGVSGAAWGSSATLLGVSCHRGAPCIAVGDYDNGRQPLAERLGSRVTREPVPSPPGSYFSELDGVSCPSRSMCMAVGYSEPNPDEPPQPESAVADL